MNTQSVPTMMVFLFVCVIVTQSLSSMHDIMHIGHDHEKTDSCQILNTFGGTEAIFSSRLADLFFAYNQIEFALFFSPRLSTKIFTYKLSRAPPAFSFCSVV